MFDVIDIAWRCGSLSQSSVGVSIMPLGLPTSCPRAILLEVIPDIGEIPSWIHVQADTSCLLFLLQIHHILSPGCDGVKYTFSCLQSLAHTNCLKHHNFRIHSPSSRFVVGRVYVDWEDGRNNTPPKLLQKKHARKNSSTFKTIEIHQFSMWKRWCFCPSSRFVPFRTTQRVECLRSASADSSVATIWASWDGLHRPPEPNGNGWRDLVGYLQPVDLFTSHIYIYIEIERDKDILI